MYLSRELQVAINRSALPLVKVDDQLMLLLRGWPTLCAACIVGSLSELSQGLLEHGLPSNMLDSSLAIETLELEKALDMKSSMTRQELCSLKKACSKSVKTLTKRKIADKNLLAELFQPPEFDESQPSELPNGVVFRDMIQNLILAERSPLTGKTFCDEKELEKFFFSPLVKAIWLDCFWWVFHERYKPDKEIQNKLFDRIALHYASLLFYGPRSFYEQAILKRLPALLSQALYTSFCCCFSQSWLNTHEFKSSICDTMGLWFSGLYPSPQSYNSWNYSKLDPERFRREELMNPVRHPVKDKVPGQDMRSFFSLGRPNSPKSNRLSKVNVQRVKNISEARSQVQGLKQGISFDLLPLPEVAGCMNVSTLVTQYRLWSDNSLLPSFPLQSHTASKSPTMKKNLFNLCGKSPLILHFLQNYTFMAQNGTDVLLTRLERSRMLPYPLQQKASERERTSLTYRDIIRLALSNMLKRRELISHLYQLHQQQWQHCDKHLRDLWDNFQREVKALDHKEAEMKKASHKFILPQPCAKQSDKLWESHLREDPPLGLQPQSPQLSALTTASSPARAPALKLPLAWAWPHQLIDHAHQRKHSQSERLTLLRTAFFGLFWRITVYL
ncbi:protein FAM227A [Suncus etruscus]|uniref:protein FAM227A n=1 Tax=Suncus etruscus TaxID=109475 RepID=UPI00210F9281|nr:protein FAM227A [Suncus etruscus]